MHIQHKVKHGMTQLNINQLSNEVIPSDYQQQFTQYENNPVIRGHSHTYQLTQTSETHTLNKNSCTYSFPS